MHTAAILDNPEDRFRLFVIFTFPVGIPVALRRGAFVHRPPLNYFLPAIAVARQIGGVRDLVFPALRAGPQIRPIVQQSFA